MLTPLQGPGHLRAHLQRHINAPSQWYYPYHCSFCHAQVELLLANARKQQGCVCRKGVRHGQHGTVEHEMWERSKRRARKKGFEHTINYTDINVPSHCPLLGIPLFRSEMHNKIEKIEYDENDPIIKDIITMLETRVRPAVASDGGDILFKNFKDGIVYLELHGSCSGCPSSTATLKNGIESMLKHYIPEVLSVEAVNGTNSLEDL
jgi:Fe-S cluster biogenesis protein NfuA